MVGERSVRGNSRPACHIAIKSGVRGATVNTVCGARTGRTERAVTVTAPGGQLLIEWREDDHVVMTGPAEWEFCGRFDPATGAWERDGETAAREGAA